MVGLGDLWLAIVLAAVGVFIVSSLVHMVLQWHNNDYGKMPGEDEIMEAMRGQSLAPGQYMFPRPDTMKDWQSPEMKAKLEKGPVGFLSVMPGFTMGKSLGLWFAYSILISFVIAYVLTLSLKSGVAYMDVFRLACTLGVLGYALPPIVDSIWKGIRWGITGRFIADGILYALVTAGVFAWQFPTA